MLVVDDDPEFCEALRDRLDVWGFHVHLAGSGPEALRLVRADPPALVVLDLVRPVRPGVREV